MPTARKVLCGVYALIALLALAFTWSQIIGYTHDGLGAYIYNYWHDVKVTPASRNITADALMLGMSVAILMVIEARKHGVRFVWLYIAGFLLIGVSVMVPLFLIGREIRMGSKPLRLRRTDVILLVLAGVGVLALTIWVVMG